MRVPIQLNVILLNTNELLKSASDHKIYQLVHSIVNMSMSCTIQFACLIQVECLLKWSSSELDIFLRFGFLIWPCTIYNLAIRNVEYFIILHVYEYVYMYQLVVHVITVCCCVQVGRTALHEAAYKSEYDVCRLLLQNGADVNSKSKVRKYSDYVHITLEKEFIIRCQNSYYFLESCKSNPYHLTGRHLFFNFSNSYTSQNYYKS